MSRHVAGSELRRVKDNGGATLFYVALINGRRYRITPQAYGSQKEWVVTEDIGGSLPELRQSWLSTESTLYAAEKYLERHVGYKRPRA